MLLNKESQQEEDSDILPSLNTTMNRFEMLKQDNRKTIQLSKMAMSPICKNLFKWKPYFMLYLIQLLKKIFQIQNI